MTVFCLHCAVQLAKGYPLPTLGNMELVKTELQILKVKIIIGSFLEKNFKKKKIRLSFGKK